MSDELKAVGRFLKEAPPGEYEDCVQAIKGFIDDQSVLEEAVNLTKEEWLVGNCTTIDIDDHKAILCEEAKHGDGQFVDPVTCKVFNYDFVNQKVVENLPQPKKEKEPKPATEEEDGEKSPEEEQKAEEEQNEAPQEITLESTEFREKLQSAGSRFASVNFHNGVCGAYDSDGSVKVVVRASSISKQNFRTGLIVLRFTCADGTIKGNIELKTHFYEHGNCLGTQSAEFEDSYDGDDDGARATNVIKKVTAFVNKWNDKISEGFDLLNSEGLNKLRRKKPISTQLVNWAQELRGLGAMPGQK